MNYTHGARQIIVLDASQQQSTTYQSTQEFFYAMAPEFATMIARNPQVWAGALQVTDLKDLLNFLTEEAQRRVLQHITDRLTT